MALLEGNALLYTVTCLACLGFFLIGYDNGLMGGLTGSPAFDNSLGIDPSTNDGTTAISLVVSLFDLGCFGGSTMLSFFGEELGRRKSIAMGSCIMIVGAVLQASSYGRAQMYVGRVVSGWGLGFINSTVPVMMAEFAPKASRGVYVCAQLSTLNFGIFLVYWIDYAFGTIAGSPSYAWRIPVILQCLFLVGMLFILLLIPETPRWLVAHDRDDEALDVMRRLYRKKMDDQTVVGMHNDILRAVNYEKSIGSGRWSDLLKNDAISSQRRFLIACSIQAFQQLGGINALIYYANYLFQESLGFSTQQASLMSGYLNTWFFVVSFVPWFLIDRVGRRPLLISMVSLMAAVMVVQTGLIWNVQNKTSIAKGAGAGAAAMLFIFQGAFSIGFQACVWVYPSEILPLRLRQRGSAVSTAFNWLFNFVTVFSAPHAVHNIGYQTYIIYAVFNAAFVPIMYLFYPETKGLALEDVDRLFSKGNEEAERSLSLAPEHKYEPDQHVHDVEKSSS